MGKVTQAEERFRLYIDETGDHVFNQLEKIHHRFLCLLGCWIKTKHYEKFHSQLEKFKQRFVPHHPDDPVILHREDIVNRRGSFGKLCNASFKHEFNEILLSLINQTEFQMIAVVIDKKKLRENYGEASSHPYHLGIEFMLQRYCGYLNSINRIGDVMVESRGKKEDGLLKDAYKSVYENGGWHYKKDFFQNSLSSKDLKVKPKAANISGLQLADLLANPIKKFILTEKKLMEAQSSTFSLKLIEILQTKWNRKYSDGTIEGYGWVLFPK